MPLNWVVCLAAPELQDMPVDIPGDSRQGGVHEAVPTNCSNRIGKVIL
jgi:hypothetical protein